MVSLILLLVGLICAYVSRILLFIPATGISFGWSIGVWLPFGPFFFRRTFPDLAKGSAAFRILTILCLGLFPFVGASPAKSSAFSFVKQKSYGSFKFGSGTATGYGTEKNPMDERRAANTKELEHLVKWGEELKIKKRDLLRSDVEGNRAYEKEFAKYNAELAKANAEKAALAAAE